MRRNIKMDMKKRARIAMGILNLLRDDINQVRVDANDFDMVCLAESVRDAKSTLQMLTDNITEIEYMMYMINSRDT